MQTRKEIKRAGAACPPTGATDLRDRLTWVRGVDGGSVGSTGVSEAQSGKEPQVRLTGESV